jgi:hypothetical protein
MAYISSAIYRSIRGIGYFSYAKVFMCINRFRVTFTEHQRKTRQFGHGYKVHIHIYL